MPDIVFDIVGTCISYGKAIEAIDHRIGDKLKSVGVTSSLFFYFWLAGCERDFSYLSQAKKYQPFAKIFESTFYRSLFFCGISEPDKFASEGDLKYIMEWWLKLEGRPELKEMFRLLRDYGFTIWCLTDASKERVSGYFRNSGVDMPSDNLVSCDSIGAGKPEAIVYQTIADKVPSKGSDIWFAAAHMWDSCAAKQAGFKTAWSAVHEGDPCTAIFGKPDVIATGLVDMAEKIIAKHKEMSEQ